MAFKTISVPAILVNDELIRVVPNSFKYQGGEGEVSVRAASAGAGSTETAHAENVEMQISKATFSVYLDALLDGKIRDWKDNTGSNEIKATQRNVNGVSFVRVFSGMSLTNHPDREASADGVVELEFQGDAMIIQ